MSGSASSVPFVLPPGSDSLTLPALRKESDGRYLARHLDLSLGELIHLRRNAIRAALQAFDPDVLIVDNVPRGAVGELDPALEELCARGRTRCVLGLRDVLDDPEAVGREWALAANDDALRRYYDAVWVYADPRVYDPARAYRFPPDVTRKLHYTGYFDHRVRLEFSASGGDPLARLKLPDGGMVLCLVGGGEDGGRLAEAFAEATLPPGQNGVILTGPFMPAEVWGRLRRRAEGHPRLRVLPFLSEPSELLSRADRVVSMGGYNTVWEVLSFEKPALVVPRVKPRTEQLIRAERLRELGLIDLLHPDRLSPATLSEWLGRKALPRPAARERVDLGGLGRLTGLLAGLGVREGRSAGD